MVVWDYELSKPVSVAAKLRNAISGTDFDFTRCTVSTVEWQTAKALFDEYHCQGSNVKPTITIAACVDGGPIAACIFARPTSREIAGVRISKALELARLVINPKYQARNFGTWLLSRAVKIIKKSIPTTERLLTLADPTFGHRGDIFRAANWKLDGQVPADYWYYHRRRNQAYHKQVVYSAAKKLAMSEDDYAKRNHLIKVVGQKRNRFVYNMR